MSATNEILTDACLIQRLALDDQVAFGILYERYFVRLFNHAVQKTGDRFVAQEIVQELFINLWQQRGRFSTLNIVGSVNGYLFTAAKHLIIDHYRREAARTRHRDAFADLQPLISNQTEEYVWTNDLQQTYERLLDRLPDKCRQVFFLSRQGYSNREIAGQEGIAEKTVEQHITKALRLLRQYLPEHLTIWLLLSLLL
ncbi:MAG: RNA polymerase sigma-70 factor [Bacteroidetes bacterium]|nr:RNA polymerase sigma-70 factor [Fibrella sp.]